MGPMAVNDGGQALVQGGSGLELYPNTVNPPSSFCPAVAYTGTVNAGGPGNAEMLSNGGEVLGSECGTSGEPAVLWDGSSSANLTVLAPLAAGDETQAFAISSQGVVFGRSGSGDSTPVEWGDPTDTAVAPQQIDGILGSPVFVSSNGQYLVTTGQQGLSGGSNDYYLYKLNGGMGGVTVSNGNAVPEPASGSNPVTFTITLPAVQSAATTVEYDTMDGTATAAANE
jgi:hypothetical protein